MDRISNRATDERPPRLRLVDSDRVFSAADRQGDQWAPCGAAARAWVLNYQAGMTSTARFPSKPAA